MFLQRKLEVVSYCSYIPGEETALKFSLEPIIVELVRALFILVEDIRDHPILSNAGIERLLQFQHLDRARHLHVNIIIGKPRNTSIVPLLRTCTTATMGYVSADSIHHLYPGLLERRIAVASTHQARRCCIPVKEAVPHWQLASEWQDHLVWLRERGFVIQDSAECSGKTDLKCIADPRGFCDPRSLRFDFDDSGVRRSPWYEVGAGFVGHDIRMVPEQGCTNRACKYYRQSM